MEDRNVRRGDIYHADLDPVFGSEQGGYRPVLVIQNNIGNQYSPTVIVAAITSKEKMKLPTHIAGSRQSRPHCSPGNGRFGKGFCSAVRAA